MENFRGNDGLPVNMGNILTSSKIFNVHCFVENDNFISFRCGMSVRHTFVTIYNKKTDEVQLADIFSNDLIYKHDKTGMFGRFVFSDEKGAYDILDTQDINMFDSFMTSIRNNEVVPDLDKLDELLKLVYRDVGWLIIVF